MAFADILLPHANGLDAIVPASPVIAVPLALVVSPLIPPTTVFITAVNQKATLARVVTRVKSRGHVHVSRNVNVRRNLETRIAATRATRIFESTSQHRDRIC